MEEEEWNHVRLKGEQCNGREEDDGMIIRDQ